MNQIYTGLALMAVLAGAVFYHFGVVKERDAYKAQNSILEQSVKDHKALEVKQNAALVEANVRAHNQYEANQVITNETQKLRACIANKSCGVVVHFKTVEVPVTPNVHPAPGGPLVAGDTNRPGVNF